MQTSGKNNHLSVAYTFNLDSLERRRACAYV